MQPLVPLVNPRRACARVTVFALCVYPSVTALAASASILNMEPTILTGEFSKNLPFKSYSVKKPK